MGEHIMIDNKIITMRRVD